MKYEIVSKDDLMTTVDKVKAALKGHGFGTLFQMNFKDKFKEHNIDYPNDYIVLEVCNPSYARQILDISSDAAYFLPCKIIIYQTDAVRIGMIKPSEMLYLVTDNPQAMQMAKEVEDILKSSINY